MSRIDKVAKKFLDGHACSQAILSEYCSLFGLDPGIALRLAAGFAAGMRRGDTCGAVTGAFMVLGLKFSGPGCEKMEGRKAVYEAVCEFARNFEEVHGTILCRDLLKYDVGTPEGMQAVKDQNLFQTLCPKFVKTAAELLEALLEKP